MTPHPSTPVKHIEPNDAHDMVRSKNALIVDVRESAEWAGGHIPGAVHIPLDQIEARAREIPTDRPVIMQCRSGARSAVAAAMLASQGADNVVNLAGGIMEWADAGLPTER